ncbi:MAG: Xaa-Pro peptidase family protein [Gammaproteobacteria bacterium]|nr:Xaa-Pro peptidase family protein [Gammaproteobacteria bacterium]
MKRRDILKSALVGGTMIAAPGCATSVEANAPPKEYSMPPVIDPGRLTNEPWARQVMRQAGVDGLVAMSDVNVFYLTNYHSFLNKMQVPNPSFGIFPLDEHRQSALVASSVDQWAISNAEKDYPSLVAYSMPADWRPYLDRGTWSTAPDASQEFGSIWPSTPASLSEREQSWLAAGEQSRDTLEASPAYALARALRECGLEKGRIAVDDMRIADLLNSIGFDRVTCIEGDNLFRKIRVIKSDVEIAHMRRIARVNQDASMATIRQIQPGATHAEINQIFAHEAARRGATAMWLVAGGVGGLPNAQCIEGEPILFDAVCQSNNYHGDFGRTVCIGEPSKKLQKRAALIRAGWQAAFEMMRPGARYSDIQRVARSAMKKTGLPEARIGVTPHSVGLQHTDEPYRDGLPFTVKDDLVLRENMTMTVDFPSMELGWGSCHLEDLIRITSDGAEPLASMDGALIVV